MNFDMLYSIAIDLINKNDLKTINPTGYVCILISQNENIFKGVSGNTIKDGKLISLCAEYETIKTMLESKESKIIALAVINIKTMLPCIPCEDCKKLILEVNPENESTLIMQSDKSFIKLNNLISTANPIDTIDDNSMWDDGWDIEPTSETDATMTNQDINSIGLNDIPKPEFNDNESSIYQTSTTSRYIESMNMTDTSKADSIVSTRSISIDSLTSSSKVTGDQATIQSQSNSTFARQRMKAMNKMSNNHSENTMNHSVFIDSSTSTATDMINEKKDKKSKIKKKLKEKSKPIKANKVPKSNEESSEKPMPSKKELKAIAKERKKQAKKNIKIMQAIEKHSR